MGFMKPSSGQSAAEIAAEQEAATEKAGLAALKTEEANRAALRSKTAFTDEEEEITRKKLLGA